MSYYQTSISVKEYSKEHDVEFACDLALTPSPRYTIDQSILGIGGTRFISFEGRNWHNTCFVCSTCKTSMVGKGFITDGDDIICPECAKKKLMADTVEQ